MSEWLVFDPDTGVLTAFSLPVWAAALLVCVPLVVAALIVFAVLWRRRRRAAKAEAEAEAEVDTAPETLVGPVESYTVGKLHGQGAREYQQDCFGVSDEALLPTHGLLAVVADGMGGLSDGDRVSVAAVQTALDAFTRRPGGERGDVTLLVLAGEVVRAVNELLGPAGLRKSGSTLAMALLRDGKLYFLTVGDSRIYLRRGRRLVQLNREHIYRNELALRAVNGELSLADALGDKKGGALTSFVGMGALKGLDMPAAPLTLFPGDKVVLMSDGVYNALSDEEMNFDLEHPPELAAKALWLSIADKDFPKQDNFTAVILACHGGQAEADGTS